LCRIFGRACDLIIGHQTSSRPKDPVRLGKLLNGDCPATRAGEPGLARSRGRARTAGKEKILFILRLSLIFLSTSAYLGLAILGRGGFVAFFSHKALAALAVVLFALAGAAVLAGGNLRSGVREDRSNRWVIAALALIGLSAAYLPAYADRMGFWILGGDRLRWLGVFLFAAGGALRIWPVFVLGHRFSGLVAIQPGHALATKGVYRVIRHPSYLGLLVSAFGWGLAFRSGVGVLLATLMVPPLVARIGAEERLLRSQFGAAYEAYCARTARLVPGFY
jgi:protein-S-isoprenylcysteine O-methyltransferase Ste14